MWDGAESNRPDTMAYAITAKHTIRLFPDFPIRNVFVIIHFKLLSNLRAIFLHLRAASRSTGLEQLASISTCDRLSRPMIVLTSVLLILSSSSSHGTSILSKSMPCSFIKLPRAIIFSRVVVTLKARVRSSGCAGTGCSLG